MGSFHQTKHRNKVLFLNGFVRRQHRALEKCAQLLGRPLEPLILLDTKKLAPSWLDEVEHYTLLRVDFGNQEEIQTTLKPYVDEILTATCVGDSNVPFLTKVIPFIPYCVLPTQASLEWTTEKIKMRTLLRNYDKRIAPKFVVAHDYSKETIDKIEKTVGYPLVVKPSGLAASLLVSICYHREELEKVLERTIKKMVALYKAKNGRGEPKVLVEQFMEGDMYSVDAYVNAHGVMYFAPLVYVKTGREVGFDDFFGYIRMTPTQLNPTHVTEAQEAAAQGIRALGLRSTSCHVELMRTEKGWKVIELGPRIGGFRHEMYELSYGIDHSLNDILIRLEKKPLLPKKVKGYTAVLQFYAQKEGKLVRIQGLFKVQALQSLQRVKVHKEPGDRCAFAKHGGDPVLEVVLFDASRSNVLADIRRIEQNLKIMTQ